MPNVSTPINLQVKTSYKQILKIALPIAAAIFVPPISFGVNSIFLGNINRQSLAAAGITGVYYLVFSVIGNGFCHGLQSLISRRAGESNSKEIGSLFIHGVFIALALGLLGILFTWFVAPNILGFALHDKSNVQLVVGFLKIRIFGLPLLYLYQLRNAILIGTNQSKYLIIGTTTETATIILLDYMLIYGKWGMPALGFNGAAYASIIAEMAGLLSIFFIMRNKAVIKQLGLFKNLQFNQQNIRFILARSLPLVLQYTIKVCSWQFFFILLEHHGTTDLAISNTMGNVLGLFGCFTWAYGSTANSMVSNIIGQGQQDKVIGLIKKITVLSVSTAVFISILLNLFPHQFLSLYGQKEDFITEAIPVLRVVSIGLVIMSVSVVWVNAVTGSGNTKMNLRFETVTIILYTLYNYLVLEKFKLSIMYGWGSEWLYRFIMLAATYWYMQSGRWKKKTN